jgi:HEAT repeat protein
MRVIILLSLLCSASTVFASGAIEPPQPATTTKEQGIATNYDDVIQDLVGNLGRDLASAQDAAIKLGSLGKRALPAVIEALNANYNKEKGNPQVVLYAAIALARIRSADAAKALLPIMSNTKAQFEARCAALTAIGLEYLEESTAVLSKIAVSDPVLEVRRHAYSRLMTLAFSTTSAKSKEPNVADRSKQWQAVEKVFLDALNDPDTEIRTIAAKQCYFAAKVYRDAAPALIAAAEKEPVEAVRSQVFLALGRMQAREAVPTLVRIYTAEDTAASIQKLALNSINMITTMDFKDKAALQRWWEKFGEKEYTKYEQVMKQLQKKAEAEAAAQAEKAAQPDLPTPASPDQAPNTSPLTGAAPVPAKAPPVVSAGDAPTPKPVEGK